MNVEDQDGNTPLHIAVKRNQTAIVEKILETTDQVQLSIPNKKNDTVVHLCSKHEVETRILG